jgi:hypothetical protein
MIFPARTIGLAPSVAWLFVATTLVALAPHMIRNVNFAIDLGAALGVVVLFLQRLNSFSPFVYHNWL